MLTFILLQIVFGLSWFIVFRCANLLSYSVAYKERRKMRVMQEQSKERCEPPKAKVCALTVKPLCPDHTGQLLVPRAPCELLGWSLWGRGIRAPGGE